MNDVPGASARLPRGIWILGFVSLLMDVSSEMIHALLPLFLATSLGASALVIGLIDGAAEATALIVKVFSGVVSDWIGKRKALAVLGYGLGALTKPLFAIAPAPSVVLGARLLDRVGKGIRGAPRDALVADLAPPERRGEAFGLRQSLDTVGAFLGPLLAIGLMLAWADDFRRVFWIAVIPGMAAVALLAFGVQDPKPRAAGEKRPFPLRRENLRRLGPTFRAVVAAGALLTLARFSEAFLVLRAHAAGMPVAWAPLVLVGMNVVYSVAAYPFGKLADRMPARPLLLWGVAVLVFADLLLAAAPTPWTVGLGVALWGLQMAMTQGLLSALVAGAAPADLRGTAFGVFNLASGVALLLASVIAGLLWDRVGGSATFVAGAAIAAVAAVALTRLKVQDAARA